MIVSCNVCFLLVPHFDLGSSGIFRADCQLAAVSTLLSTPAIPSLCPAFFPPKNEGPPKPFSGQLATYAEVVPLCISARSLASFSHKITIHLLGNVFQSRNAVSHLVTSYHLTTHSCAPEKPNSLKNSNRECLCARMPCSRRHETRATSGMYMHDGRFVPTCVLQWIMLVSEEPTGCAKQTCVDHRLCLRELLLLPGR